YFDVHPSYGSLDDFTTFLGAAHARNMRVVTELVVNHTSDQHPWFQRARRAAPGTPERDFYVWSDTPDRFEEVRIIFSDTETSNWAWDPVAGAYYWHRFFSHQPDLNYDNPLVREAIIDVFRFWLDLGVDGLRLDAVPYLFERDGTNGENLPETHEELKRIRAFVDENYENRMLLAEANQWPEDSAAYFGDGDECHMAFHFPLMPRLFLALQLESRLPIIDILEQTPEIPYDAQWAIFLRNHDELTLEMVSEEERDLLWRAYSPDRRARLNLGIRRRLAPLLENDRRRIELLFSLLLSLPGTPVIYYGDEIGMGDNVFLADRDGVRTPMQWSNDRNAGFSRANAQSLYLPVVVDPQFHYETVNVEAQQANPNSLLSWVRLMIRHRQRHPVFGRGSIEFLSPDNDQVLAYLRDSEDQTLLVVANLSRHSQFVELNLARLAGQRPTEMLGRTEFPIIAETPYPLSVGPYGFYWFTIASPDSPTQERRDALEITGPLEGAMAGEGALADAVGRFMSNQSWYQGRPPRRSQTTVVDLVPLTPGEQDAAFWVALVAVGHDSGSQDLYVQTIGISFEPDAQLPASAIISAVHRDGTDGFVFDGLADPRGRTVLLDLVLAGDTLLGIAGSLSGNLAPTAADVTSDSPVDSTVHTNDRGETYIDYANGLTIKLFHRIEPGTNPDLELRRFLTERTAFEGVADTYGALEYLSGESHTVGILQQSFTQTPSAWSVFEQHCHSWLATVPDRMPPADPPPIWSRSDDAAGFSLPSVDLLQPALDLATELGSMTARLHLALGSFSEDPDLGTEPFTQHYQHSLYQSLRAGIRREFRAMRRLKTSAGPAIEEAIDDLLRAERECLDWLDAIRKKRIKGARIRLHGDYRLDEVFLVDGEFVIEDLSGDHSRPMSERRLRGSGLGDIAQMLRSFEYVGSSCALDRSRADQAWSVWWSQLVGNAFVTRYLTDLDGSLLLPDSSEAIDDLLRAFLMSRALRELHWELQNRQEWASIPLAELRRMLEQRPWFVDRD
ncbi:MAG: maltose alpha-D-glucosyltransferase, partial [Acidimicrobiia bacterium]|nr:maltose alpha-D-glucosyltransferase [Acidimicrobiia bacterium]